MGDANARGQWVNLDVKWTGVDVTSDDVLSGEDEKRQMMMTGDEDGGAGTG